MSLKVFSKVALQHHIEHAQIDSSAPGHRAKVFPPMKPDMGLQGNMYSAGVGMRAYCRHPVHYTPVLELYQDQDHDLSLQLGDELISCVA